MTMNYKQLYAIQAENRKRVLRCNPEVPTRSGIYILLREEAGIRYAYVGQAVNLLRRLADHLQGYQHIDLSLKKHKLWSEQNPSGWRILFFEFPAEELDEKEQQYIREYANAGYQLRNKTIGGQGAGKKGLENEKPSKTYRDGLKQGYKNAQREIAHLFELHLNFSTKKTPPTKTQEKAAEKFLDFLKFNG